MVLSDFVMLHIEGKSPINWVYFAEVTVTTTKGMLWWKRKTIERRAVSRTYVGVCLWHFVDTGTWCPEFQVDALERSYEALKVLHCLKGKSAERAAATESITTEDRSDT